jgi:hypothetical protein
VEARQAATHCAVKGRREREVPQRRKGESRRRRSHRGDRPQVGDLNLWNAHDLTERFYSGKTRARSNAYPRAGTEDLNPAGWHCQVKWSWYARGVGGVAPRDEELFARLSCCPAQAEGAGKGRPGSAKLTMPRKRPGDLSKRQAEIDWAHTTHAARGSQRAIRALSLY